MNEKPKRGPGRPPAPMKADPKERQTAIRIRPEVYTALRVESDRHGVTMVAMLNDVLRYWSLAGAAWPLPWDSIFKDKEGKGHEDARKELVCQLKDKKMRLSRELKNIDLTLVRLKTDDELAAEIDQRHDPGPTAEECGL